MKKWFITAAALLLLPLLFACGTGSGTPTTVTTPQNQAGTSVTTPQNTEPEETEPDTTTPAQTTGASDTQPDTTEPQTPPAVEEEIWDRIGDAQLREAMQELYALYDPDTLIAFFASMWDPQAGAFYYAPSARDYEGFGPDIESTYQILNMLRGMGALESGSSLPDLLGTEMTAKIVTWIQNTQNPDDGYFYNPQFSSDIGVMRRSRDLASAIRLLEWLEAEPLYPTALERLEDRATQYMASGDDDDETGGNYLTDPQALEAYVQDLFSNHSTEGWSNTLSAPAQEFLASGMLSTLLDMLDDAQDPESGMWVTRRNADGTYLAFNGQNESAYGVLTAAYKIAFLYNTAGRPIAHADAFIESAKLAVLSDITPATVCYLFNPWASLSYLRSNLAANGGDITAYENALSADLPQMLDCLIQKLSLFRKTDGSYSYYPGGSLATIYGTTVSLGVYEGDVNGTLIAIKSISDAACNVLGLGASIPLFTPEHGNLFVQLCSEAEAPVKKPRPSEPNSMNGLADNYLYVGTNKSGTLEYGIPDPTGAENENGTYRFTKTEAGKGGQDIYYRFLDGSTSSRDLTRGNCLQISFDLYIDSATLSDAKFYNICYQCTFRLNDSGNNGVYMLLIRMSDLSSDEEGAFFYLADMTKESNSEVISGTYDGTFLPDTWNTVTLQIAYTTEGNGTFTFGNASVLLNGEHLGYTASVTALPEQGDSTVSQAIYNTQQCLLSTKRACLFLSANSRLTGEIYFDNFTAQIKNNPGP